MDCVPCLVKQALRAAKLAKGDRKVLELVLRRVMKALSEEDWDTTPPELAQTVYRIVRDLTGVNDPFLEVKRLSNEEALRLYPKVKSALRESKDPLLTAVKAAIAGNVIDFGALEEPVGELERQLLAIMRKGFAINDYPSFRKKALEAESLLLFADNSGEIVFDKLLIETLNVVRAEPLRRVTLVVKGGPIINDATREDVEQVGFDEVPGLEVKTISNGDPGTGPQRRGEEVYRWVEEHDLVVAKGQGNYECLSDRGGLFFLLIAKCPVIAEDLGVKVGDLVLKYNKP